MNASCPPHFSAAACLILSSQNQSGWQFPYKKIPSLAPASFSQPPLGHSRQDMRRRRV